MKKKKLKKKIEALERQLASQKEQISNLSEKYVNFGMKYNKERNQLIKECNEKDGKVDILWEWLQRSGIDFSDWVVSQKSEVTLLSIKDCKKCKYDGLDMDGPCYGCTATDKKMFKPKEDSTNGDETVSV